MAKPYTPKYDWPIKTRPNDFAKIPYAYVADANDIRKLIPNMEILPFIERAIDFINDGNSIRSTADWLSVTAGKKISHEGMEYIWRLKCGSDPNNLRVKRLRKLRRERAPKTPEEIEAYKLRHKMAGAKRSAARSETKLARLNEVIEAKKNASIVEPEEIYYPPFDPVHVTVMPKEMEDREIAFTPNVGPQTDFLAATEREVLYGGAAGGGKSYALIADPMRYFDNPNFRGLILRRTNDELRELIWKSQELYSKAFPGAKWKEQKSIWVFPSGAQLWMTYLERDEDVLRYQGQAFSYIAVDELTHYPTPFAWDYLRSRLRTTDPTLPIYMRATTNPGGPGHMWVKKMFIDPAPPNVAFDATDIEKGEVLVYPSNYHDKKLRGKPLFQRRFIPARLSDNPYLYQGGEYEGGLLSLPEAQRKKLLEGDWNIIEGAAFPEFNTKTHVVEPYKIPKGWRRFRSCDFGYSSFTAVHWFAIDPVYETLIVYRELYVSKHTGRDLAAKINAIEAQNDEKVMYGVLDSSVWHTRGQFGPSIAEEMIQMGCKWRPSDRTKGSRTAGYNRLHELLKTTHYSDAKEVPGIVFFNTCRQIIADLQVIPVDPNGNDDIDEKYPSDHSYDSIRYGIMSRPRASSPWDFQDITIQGSHKPTDLVFGY
jgi:hypothetical protein